MSTTQQSADTDTTRDVERVKPNVTTSETIAAMYAPPAKEEADKDESKEESKSEEKQDGKDGKKAKKPFSERIQELVAQRREAESKAERAEREADELRRKLEAIQAKPEPVKEEPKPARVKYTSDEEYIEALAEWKASQALAKREKEQADAQAKAYQEQLAADWKRRQDSARAEIDDYTDVISKSDVALPGHLHQAILESEVGPHLAYYFAKHPSEAKRFASMSPTTALRQLGKLEDKLIVDEDDHEEEKKPTSTVEKSKAPPPINPPKEGRAPNLAPANIFDEYRAKRKAERK